jgi:ABC-type glycerol-3-phosphate transport system substrate-binding protein
MKKTLPIAIVLLLVVTLVAGCSGNSSSKSDADSSGADSKASQSVVNQTQSGAAKADAEYNTLTLDLTAFTPTEASEVAHKISECPGEYLGTRIKVRGVYEAAENYNTGDYIHAVTVTNQVQCCPAVLEFIWNGEHSYPEDYPKEFSEIEIEGVMKRYREAGETFFYLAVDDITVAEVQAL